MIRLTDWNYNWQPPTPCPAPNYPPSQVGKNDDGEDVYYEWNEATTTWDSQVIPILSGDDTPDE